MNCSSLCPSNHFGNKENFMCEICDKTCKECAQTSKMCTACYDRFMLEGGACVRKLEFIC